MNFEAVFKCFFPIWNCRMQWSPLTWLRWSFPIVQNSSSQLPKSSENFFQKVSARVLEKVAAPKHVLWVSIEVVLLLQLLHINRMPGKEPRNTSAQRNLPGCSSGSFPFNFLPLKKWFKILDGWHLANLEQMRNYFIISENASDP